MTSLKVDGLTVERGGRTVFSALSFRLDAGAALAVVGANGAGKSTLLRTVAGLIRPREGSVRLDGVDGPAAASMHLVAHQNAIKLPLSAEQNVRFWIHALGRGEDAAGGGAVETDERVEAALERVGLLRLAEPPAQLFSQGQRRRLALARLLAVPRPLWLLDEPTAGLDAASREAFAALMADHLAAGGMILAATHEPLGVVAGTLDITAAALSGEAA